MEQTMNTIRQFAKFGIVGVGNSTIDFTLYLLGTRMFNLHFLLANTISWIAAVSFSFAMNKYWTFSAHGNSHIREQSAKFILVSIGSLMLSQLLLYSQMQAAGMHDLIAKIVTIGVVGFWNVFMNKFWTFRHD